MKKILLSIVLLLSVQLIFAGGPLKFRAGVIVLPTNTWLLSSGFNQTVLTTDIKFTPKFTLNTNLGAALGLNFTDLLGIELDVIFGKFKQDMKYEIDGFGDNFTIEISKTDIPLLLKVGGLMYFEVGPQYTMISKVEHTLDGESDEVSDYYSTSQLFGVIGTGAGFSIPKIARIEAGLRLAYGLQDLSSHKKDPNDGSILWNDKKLNQMFWALKIAVVHEF